MTIERFFMKSVPALARQRLREFAAVQGSIAWLVFQCGAWTVHLGNVVEPVVTGFSPQADLRLWVTAPAFQRFVDGTLDPASAIEKRELIAYGDVGVMERFGYFLSGGVSPLGLRAGQAMGHNV